jgi:peptidoglycan-associated lipoprotein
MKVRDLLKAFVIGCSILSLAACSHMHKNPEAEAADGGPATEQSAQTAGAGDSESFGTAGMNAEQLLAKRTYYFNFDSSSVNDNEKPAIYANAEKLVASRHAKILLEGHTDPRGSREYNVALGERRANSVAEILKSKGVSPDQIRVISYGAERLAVQGRSDEDFRRDRRVVLVYLQQ